MVDISDDSVILDDDDEGTGDDYQKSYALLDDLAKLRKTFGRLYFPIQVKIIPQTLEGMIDILEPIVTADLPYKLVRENTQDADIRQANMKMFMDIVMSVAEPSLKKSQVLRQPLAFSDPKDLNKVWVIPNYYIVSKEVVTAINYGIMEKKLQEVKLMRESQSEHAFFYNHIMEYSSLARLWGIAVGRYLIYNSQMQGAATYISPVKVRLAHLQGQATWTTAIKETLSVFEGR